MNSSCPLNFPTDLLSPESQDLFKLWPDDILAKLNETIQGAKLVSCNGLGATIMKMKASLSLLHKEKTGYPVIEIGGHKPSVITFLLVVRGAKETIQLSLDEVLTVAANSG